MRLLVEPCQLNSGVVGLKNLVVAEALFGEAISANLAHADAVSPAAAEKNEAGNAA